jgi:hypothetical protein
MAGTNPNDIVAAILGIAVIPALIIMVFYW